MFYYRNCKHLVYLLKAWTGFIAFLRAAANGFVSMTLFPTCFR